MHDAANPPAAAPPKSVDQLLTGTVDPKDPGFVHYGNVRVEAALQKPFEAAERYLCEKSPDAVAALRTLEGASHVTTVKGITDQNDLYQPSTRTIEWDPKSAMTTTNGGTQSAALGLLHEETHAVHNETDPALFIANQSTPDRAYQNLEEKSVITGVETRAAKALGEGTRTDHSGSPFHARDAISRVPETHRASLTPAEALPAIATATATARTSGQSSPPEPTSAIPWDGKTHTGSIVHLDPGHVAQSVGRGEYVVYDVQKDLHGVTPPAGNPGVSIDHAGGVQVPQTQGQQR